MGLENHTGGLILVVMLVTSAALSTVILTWLCMPLLRRYAMARPNARSSHRIPTPQGGGAPVILVTLLLWCLPIHSNLQGEAITLSGFQGTLAGAALAMALLGAVDDIHPLPAKLRLAFQTVLVAAVLIAAPNEWRIAPMLPLALERILAVIAGVWFVNLTNFMDGIDGMTVSEVAPLALAIAVFSIIRFVFSKPNDMMLAAALAGALLGFLVFNRPPAKVFLGDVGSLPIGLIVAALLFELAVQQGFIPAIILPMYYLYDATGTLLKGIARGENVFEAHRRHAYQNAVDGGWSAGRVCRWVLCLNLLLVVLAGFAMASGAMGQLAMLALAVTATAFVSQTFRNVLRNKPAS